MKRVVAAALAALLLSTAPAVAWETPTHVGLTEQAAMAANLDAKLRQLGFSGGLFEPLTVPKADAPELLASLAQHSPINGYTPDARGRQHALGWLLAGSALADATPAWAANHFFDPSNGQGWRDTNAVTERVLTRFRAMNAPDKGVPAPDWIVSRDNPLELNGFLDQYEKAVKSATPGERGRHMAGALVAAGAMLHVLGDMAVPSRVRGDGGAHREQVGNDEIDRGSRFERLAALAWGRLGVPGATSVVEQKSARAFLIELAGLTAARWFSPGTLPRAVDVGVIKREALGPALAASLRRPAPAVPRRLNLMAAGQGRGATLRDPAGVCQARYRVDHGRLSWWLDDDCLLEQAAAILPVAASYEAGLLSFLLRGDLALATDGASVSVSVGKVGLGAGTLTILGEDARGVRTAVASTQVAGGPSAAPLGGAAIPVDSRRVVALFRGVDGAGEPVVAVGTLIPSAP